MKLHRAALILTTAMALATQTGCLKTRAQIKGGDHEADGENHSGGGDDSKAGPARSSHYEIEELKNEITRISGKLEEVEHSQKGNNVTEVKEYLARLDSRVAELEKNQMLALTEIKALKDKGAETAHEAARPSGDLMGEANRLLAEKRFEEAAEKFKTVLSKAPKGKDAADAHFGLGECEYGMQNYKKAIVQYSKVQEVSAKSPRVPTSLYKIGLSFNKLNMPKEAKGFFSELVERYPKSPEAKKARAKVKE